MGYNPGIKKRDDTPQRGKSVMTKPITGQYEYTHSSGVGLDYFTSRVDRIILQANGQFIYIVQERSRLANAAQSLMSGHQVATNAPEIRREGSYTTQGNLITFHFDDGTQDQGQLAWDGRHTVRAKLF